MGGTHDAVSSPCACNFLLADVWDRLIRFPFNGPCLPCWRADRAGPLSASLSSFAHPSVAICVMLIPGNGAPRKAGAHRRPRSRSRIPATLPLNHPPRAIKPPSAFPSSISYLRDNYRTSEREKGGESTSKRPAPSRNLFPAAARHLESGRGPALCVCENIRGVCGPNNRRNDLQFVTGVQSPPRCRSAPSSGISVPISGEYSLRICSLAPSIV
jgi:hypothetical protein